jgi:hypothetical protein
VSALQAYNIINIYSAGQYKELQQQQSAADTLQPVCYVSGVASSVG